MLSLFMSFSVCVAVSLGKRKFLKIELKSNQSWNIMTALLSELQLVKEKVI